MKTAIILALLAFCSLSPAQEKSDASLPPNVRFYQPKNLPVESAPRVADFVRSLGSRVSWEDVPHAFVLRGTAQEMDVAEALLKRFDVAETRIDLVVYLVQAATSPTPAIPATPIPAELQSAVNEMKGAFKYDHYSLWDAITVQLAGAGGEVKGILPSASMPRGYAYRLNYNNHNRPLSEGRTADLSGFQFSIKWPHEKDDDESSIQTSVTVREGQKLVLGKIRLMPTDHADLFLVLSTKVY